MCDDILEDLARAIGGAVPHCPTALLRPWRRRRRRRRRRKRREEEEEEKEAAGRIKSVKKGYFGIQ
jgi:hypothetical protein